MRLRCVGAHLLLIETDVALQIYCSGAVRVYSSNGSQWEYSGVCGAVSLMIEKDLYYIRVANVTVSGT